MIPLVAWKSKWKTFRQEENSIWETFPNDRSIQPDNTVTPPSTNSPKWRASCQAYHCFVNCFHLLATLFERAEISELRMKNWVKTPSVRQLRSSHKLKTSCCFAKWGEGQTIRCLEQIKINTDEPAFSHLFWERCLIIKDGWYQTNSRGQWSYSWLESRPPNASPLHPIGAVAGCCCSSSILGLWFLPENPSFRASQAKRNTKRLSETEEWPPDAQQELQHQIASSFDISAKVFIQPLSFISTKLSILASTIKIFTYNLSISITNKHVYLKCC